MKIFIALLFGLSIQLFAKTLLNLNDASVLERFGAIIVKEKVNSKEYDEDALATWVLRTDHSQKYQNTVNDEFEFDEAKTWAFDKFKTKLQTVKPFDKDQEFKLRLGASLGGYDFKTQSFPVQALTPNSYVDFTGQRRFVDNGRLLFDNAITDVNNIAMDKKQAKAFVKSRKKNGHIDRNIVANYIYTIQSYEEKNPFQPGTPMSLKIHTLLKSVEFADKDTGKTIWKTNFPSMKELENETIEKEKELVKTMPFGKEYTSFKETYPSLNLAEFILYTVEAKREVTYLGVIEKLHPSGRTDSQIMDATSTTNLLDGGNGKTMPKRTISFEESKKIKSHLKKIILQDMNITNGTVSKKDDLEKLADVIVKSDTISASKYVSFKQHVEVDPSLKQIILRNIIVTKGKKLIPKEISEEALLFRYLYKGEDAIKFDFKYNEAIFYFRVVKAGRINTFATLQLIDNVHGAQLTTKENK